MNKLISKSTKFNLITKISNNTIYKVANHIYNNNSSLDKIKIGGSLGMIVTSKYLNVQVPIYLKEIVDNINNNLISNENISNNFINNNIFNEVNENTLYLIFAYGTVRSTSYGLHELRNIIFGNVSDNTVRNISKKTFLNILDRDIDFHQNKKIGGLTKTLDRGNKGMRYLFNSIVFNIFPLTLEIGFVTNILLNNYDSKFTYLTLGTIGIYSIYTISLTQWRTKFIKNRINYENECSANLTDSLINYDTIKYFNNEIFEGNNYENAIKKFQDENLKVIKSLGLLNFGQNAIFSISLSLSLYLCIN
uniref:Iron-sulfur clusters transporter n=1 Tax=Nucleocytoviricota sp. TaxID=2809609 RepID=A0A9E8K1H2_9VIRU|nr:iron-sulfur clusters transporter [Nucleocytoviricota sp.]